MKKVFTLATAALLMTSFAFAHEGDKKKAGKDCAKECCKGKTCKDEKKETKATAKVATKTTKKA
jgi:hypothetical protein